MKVTENNFIHELKCKNEEALDYIYSTIQEVFKKLISSIILYANFSKLGAIAPTVLGFLKYCFIKLVNYILISKVVLLVIF
ncbi:hypothetical protein [Clostridium tetanomorphum]|uniref:hypothetical protein n=1 Tax=Clostridium tetanomorphum TaxID=1553 RepID=UPI002A0F14C4|nr:hypothetical protein [Clostridium tetanomorphum]